MIREMLYLPKNGQAYRCSKFQYICILAIHNRTIRKTADRQTCRSVEGDVFGPSGLVSVRVYEILRTFTPEESVSSGHKDKVTSA